MEIISYPSNTCSATVLQAFGFISQEGTTLTPFVEMGFLLLLKGQHRGHQFTMNIGERWVVQAKISPTI